MNLYIGSFIELILLFYFLNLLIIQLVEVM